MGSPVDATELAALEDLLRTQWGRLRRWLADLDDAALAKPSVLDGWTVEHLVAHVVRVLDSLAAAQPAEAGTVPLTLAEYIGGYAEGAADIDRVTRELAARVADDRHGALDDAAHRGFAQVGVLRDLGPDPVVVARRGPILLSELLVSRLVELVVHGDDLQRSTGRRDSPVEPAALERVAEALLEVVVDRGGWSLEVSDRTAWVRLACGRVPYSVENLAAALQPTYTAGGLPDLGRTLPLL